MKSIKLRKVGLILAGAVFAMGMALNFQSALLSTDQVSGVSLKQLISVAMAGEEYLACDPAEPISHYVWFLNEKNCYTLNDPVQWNDCMVEEQECCSYPDPEPPC